MTLINIEKIKKYFPLLLLISIGIITSIIARYNQTWEADNYWHYFFSKYSYAYPKFFLHHWGKPFFILLSAPFAQFGFYSINLFNITCGLLSAWITFKFSKALNFNASWMAILLVLAVPIYFITLQSSLTEPLFGLLLILTSYLFFKEKYLWGAIVASTFMYSRSEGMFILVLYALFLLVSRNWKYIPFLASAFIIYSFAGYFSGHNFFWYFTENPYSENSGYGHGTWAHYFIKYREILGLPHTLLFVIGLCILLFKILKNKEFSNLKQLQPNIKVFLLIVVPAFVYGFFHVYAWAEGKYASAGLFRMFAPIVPFTALTGMYAIGFLNAQKLNIYLKAITCAGISFFMIYETTGTYKYPLKASGADKVEYEASIWFKKIRDPNKVVYYAHPGLMFFCDYNPFDLDLNRECRGFPSNCVYNKNEPFYYVWDSQFSESGCGNKLEDLMNCPNLKLLRVFQDGDLFKLYFFEFTP